jgi:hypothetical protein
MFFLFLPIRNNLSNHKCLTYFCSISQFTFRQLRYNIYPGEELKPSHSDLADSIFLSVMLCYRAAAAAVTVKMAAEGPMS